MIMKVFGQFDEWTSNAADIVEVPVISIYLSMQNLCPETHLSLGFDAISIMQRILSLFHPNLKENNRKWHTIWLKNCMYVFTVCKYILCLLYT